MTVLFLLQLNKLSISAELLRFFSHFDLSPVSGSALCQSRQKIDYQLFLSLNTLVVSRYYETRGDSVSKWRHLRIFGIDGSLLHLLDSAELRSHFETYHDQPMARQLFICDLLNDLCVYTAVSSNRNSEEQLLSEAFPFLTEQQAEFGPILCIYDRGFPSFSSFYEHQQAGIDFLMRCRVGFNTEVKAFVASGKVEEVLLLRAPKTATASRKKLQELGYPIKEDPGIKVRLIRVELSSGQTEVLITSLLDRSLYPTEEFAELYFKRWQVEVFIGYWKNKIRVEEFSSIKRNGVLQDIFAQMVFANLHHILCQKIDQQQAKKDPKKRRKHQYKTNKNIGIAILKIWLPKLIIEQKTELILEKLEEQMQAYLIPIRPQRSFTRNKKSRKRPACRNLKRAC